MTLLNIINECGCYAPWWFKYPALTILIGGIIYLIIDFVKTWPKDEDFDPDLEREREKLEHVRKRVDYMKGVYTNPKPGSALQMELYQLTEKSA